MNDAFTVGVEEEYLTVDAKTMDLRPLGGRLLAAARPSMRTSVQPELTLSQIEVATPVCDSLADVRTHLESLRSTLAAAARREGVEIVAVGTHPNGAWIHQAITPSERFRGLEEEFQQLARE